MSFALAALGADVGLARDPGVAGEPRVLHVPYRRGVERRQQLGNFHALRTRLAVAAGAAVDLHPRAHRGTRGVVHRKMLGGQGTCPRDIRDPQILLQLRGIVHAGQQEADARLVPDVAQGPLGGAPPSGRASKTACISGGRFFARRPPFSGSITTTPMPFSAA